MVTLTVNNSFSKIEGLKAEPFNRLRKLLSYSPDSQSAYFSGGYGPTLRYCIDKYGSFPTGLAHRVVDFLFKEEIDFDLKDSRIAPKPFSTKVELDIVPYKAQWNALDAALRAHRGIISMPTGTGKSLVIAMIATNLNVSTLVVVPSLEIKKQLENGLLGKLKNVTVANIDSVPEGKFDCLIVDEAHHVAAKTYQKLNKIQWTGIYYRFFMTATPFRNQTEETLLFEGIAGQVVYALTYIEAVKARYIVPVEAYYLEIPKQKTDAFTWAQVYSELVVNNKVRNDIIAELAVKLHSYDISTLVLVKEIAHCTALTAITGFPIVNGQDESTRKNIELFNDRSHIALIGTEGILGEGVDTKPCEYVIIAGLGKAKSAFMQKVGRAVRAYPGKESAKVILFKDKSHKFLSRHFKAQCDILKSEYGITPIKLEI